MNVFSSRRLRFWICLQWGLSVLLVNRTRVCGWWITIIISLLLWLWTVNGNVNVAPGRSLFISYSSSSVMMTSPTPANNPWRISSLAAAAAAAAAVSSYSLLLLSVTTWTWSWSWTRLCFKTKSNVRYSFPSQGYRCYNYCPISASQHVCGIGKRQRPIASSNCYDAIFENSCVWVSTVILTIKGHNWDINMSTGLS